MPPRFTKKMLLTPSPESIDLVQTDDKHHNVISSDLSWDEAYQESFHRLASRFDRAPSYSPVSDQDRRDDELSTRVLHTGSDRKHGRKREKLSSSAVSPLQFLPTEIVQDIAVRLNSDLDLSSMMKTSPTLYSILHLDETNCIWRQRFLARYDYPYLQSTLEFPFAYKVRQLVLQRFDAIAIAHSLNQRSGHQLDVIKDMVLETYNPSEARGPIPTYSKNLAILSARNPATWLIKLMSCPLYGSEKRKYGQPHLLFDMLQVSLSHLVLSPKSPVLAKIPSSRDNYDLAKVYNFNKPFATLLEALEEEPEYIPPPFRSSRFPNLRIPTPTLEPEEPRYRLNINALLHIRNFWQRHLTDDIHGIGENTYALVMKNLSMSGMRPQEWDRPLHSMIPFNTNWYGLYSCLHPWPKHRQDLEERQSCAEDWEAVDPMTLELETSTSNKEESFWPPAFSSIPAFADLMPEPSFASELNLTYIRGIAPFKDMKSRHSTVGDSSTNFPKWHPFLALRVSGFVHDVPIETLVDEDAQERRVDAYDEDNEDDADRPIPGWKHIVTVMWKPSSTYLTTVLEHAEGEYGGASATQISADWNTANISSGGNHTTPTSTTNNSPTQTSTAASTNSSSSAPTATTSNPPTEAEIEVQYSIRLKKRIIDFTQKYNDLLASQQGPSQSGRSTPPSIMTTKEEGPTPTSLPPLFSPSHIRTLEDSFSKLQFLDWDDGSIEYAYAYEGIIIPGGKIMMGRWWRIHGSEGLGIGRELGPDGIGVEVRPVHSEDTNGAGDESASGVSSIASAAASGRRKAKPKNKKKKKGKKQDDKDEYVNRRSSRWRGKKRKASAMDSDDENQDDEDDAESDFEDSEVETTEEVEREHEFVTVVNGEESRAVNGCKGLERGPFVFWTV